MTQWLSQGSWVCSQHYWKFVKREGFVSPHLSGHCMLGLPFPDQPSGDLCVSTTKLLPQLSCDTQCYTWTLTFFLVLPATYLLGTHQLQILAIFLCITIGLFFYLKTLLDSTLVPIFSHLSDWPSTHFINKHILLQRNLGAIFLGWCIVTNFAYMYWLTGNLGERAR